MSIVPGIKTLMDNSNSYLNYTGHWDLGSILKMFLPLPCLWFLFMRNTDIYPKAQDLIGLSSRPLRFWNDFPFCRLMLCTTFHAGKSIFQDIFCLKILPSYSYTAKGVIHCIADSSEQTFKPAIVRPSSGCQEHTLLTSPRSTS